MAGKALSSLSSQTTCLYLQDVTHDLSLFLRAAVPQLGQLVFQQGNLPLEDLDLLFQAFLQTQTWNGAGQEVGDTRFSWQTPVPSPSPSPAAQPSARPPAAPALLGTASAQHCAPRRVHSGHPAAAPCGWRSPAAVREAGKSAQLSGNIGGHPKSGCLQGFISHTASKVLNAGNVYRPQRTNPKCTLHPLPMQLLFLRLTLPLLQGLSAKSAATKMQNRRVRPRTLKERSPFSSESWLILRSIWPFSVFRSWHCFRASCKRTSRLWESSGTPQQEQGKRGHRWGHQGMRASLRAAEKALRGALTSHEAEHG